MNPRITEWTGRSVWLIGASSGIGRATAHALHAMGARVVVSARSAEVLQQFVDTHTGAMAVVLDVQQTAAVQEAAQYVQRHQGLDVVIYCAGYYKAQRATQFDLQDMVMHQDINYVGALRVLDAVLPALLHQGYGHISLLASVAGYRGLPQSLAYGPTKAALINLAETLYLDLSPKGIGVSLVNPGFVETPLTSQNEFHMPALIQPEQAAQAMLRDWAKGRFEIHYPKRFTLWLKLLRVLPYRWYFYLVRRATKM
jgi:NAD(P)-dependent dehydrogenase (short-subunit alcohol dehydrogenase family)